MGNEDHLYGRRAKTKCNKKTMIECEPGKLYHANLNHINYQLLTEHSHSQDELYNFQLQYMIP